MRDLAALAAAFWLRVQKQPQGCWLWTGGHTHDGYGSFCVTRHRHILAHRWSYEYHYGLLFPGLSVCHTCDVRLCVRPDHLFLGTNWDNTRDRHQKGRTKSIIGQIMLQHPERRARGERNGNVKLDASTVTRIRLLAAQGESRRAIARKFGIGKTTVSDIVNRATWQQIPERLDECPARVVRPQDLAAIEGWLRGEEV